MRRQLFGDLVIKSLNIMNLAINRDATVESSLLQAAIKSVGPTPRCWPRPQVLCRGSSSSEESTQSWLSADLQRLGVMIWSTVWKGVIVFFKCRWRREQWFFFFTSCFLLRLASRCWVPVDTLMANASAQRGRSLANPETGCQHFSTGLVAAAPVGGSR